MLYRFLHKVPTFRILIPYLMGVLILPGLIRLAWSLAVFAVGGLLLHRKLERRMSTAWAVRWIPGLSMACLWMSLGAFSATCEKRIAVFPAGVKEKMATMVRLESVPVEKPKSWQCQVCVLQSEDERLVGKNVQLYVAKDPRAKTLELGNCLLAELRLRDLETPVEPGAFDYAAWLRNKGVCATAYVPSWSWKRCEKASLWNLKVSAEKMRSALLSRFSKAGISGKEFSLVSALTLGSVQLLTKETKEQFSVSGVSHILSVSGLHVAVVYAILEFLLSFCNRFDRLRVIKQLFLILVLWLYAFMTGLSPSVIRSALMFSMIAFGGCLHRKSQTINTVLFSAFLLLLWKPSFLLDLGFELSYCAVISIVVLHQKITAVWKPASRVTGYFWEMVCLSAVAQMGTAPLTIYTFHQFPNYFMLNNLVAVPASGLIIYLAFAFLFLSDIPFLGVMLTWCLKSSLFWFQWFVQTTSELPYALTENIQIGKIEVLLLYLLMASGFVWIFMKRRKWVFVVFFCLLFLQGVALSHYFSVQNKTDLCQISAISYLCEKRNP